MIAKGNPHGDGARLARYLITGRKGERAELAELRGFIADNIRDAFAAVELQAAATRCRTPFFHAYVRLPAGEALGRDQWRHVADRIERQLGFAGQGRAIAFHHQPAGGTHMHVAWSRIDLERRRALDPGLYKNKLKEISRRLEHELSLTPVSSAPPPGRKTRAPGQKEFEQARRLGTDLAGIREAIRASWDQAPDGRSFVAALDACGLVLARGDRRDFVVIDPAGGDHALAKRITGATAAEARTRLADLDRAQLPSVDQAKALQAERAVPTPELQKIVPTPERGIPTYPAPANNAPSIISTRPIVVRAPKLTDETENGERANPEKAHLYVADGNIVRPAPAPPSGGEESVVATSAELPAIIVAAHGVPTAPAAAETRERATVSFARERERAALTAPARAPPPRKFWKAVAGELVRRVRALQPKPRRRRSEDMRGAFRAAATQIMRQAGELPAVACAAAFLSDTLDWLNLWQHNDPAGEPDDGLRYTEPNHLFPHP